MFITPAFHTSLDIPYDTMASENKSLDSDQMKATKQQAEALIDMFITMWPFRRMVLNVLIESKPQILIIIKIKPHREFH